MAQYRRDRHEYLLNGNTIFEVVMLADQYGNRIGPANPSGMAVDAFGRARTSSPLTLFDSSHRFEDNGLWSTANTAGANTQFNANAGLIEINVGTGSDQEVIRETTKVFSYQPGKSLQNMNTFIMAPAQTGLRQRVGYYGANNGIYLEQSNSDIYFVERSLVTGTVSETRVSKENWNFDPLDGTGPSRKTLDITKGQILFSDVEWLGLGTVRMGFVIDGEFIHCHSFHHANLVTSTYITTASLPLRYEIKNTAATASPSCLKQVCSTVISEGGYELRGLQQAIATPIATPRDLTNAGTYYPVISIRLKSDFLDAIVIPTALSLLGVGNNSFFNWRIVAGGTVTTASWTSAGANSAVEYTLTGTAHSGGRIVAQGFTNSDTQGANALNILKQALFQFQLERNGLNDTPEPFTLVVASKVAGDDVYAALDWEEVSR